VVDTLTVDGNTVAFSLEGGSYTFTNVTNGHTIGATFKAGYAVDTETELTTALAIDGSTIYLVDDFSVSSSISVTNSSVIDLNGHTISVGAITVTNRSFLNLSTMPSGETLTIGDSTGGGGITLGDGVTDVPIFLINNSSANDTSVFAGTLNITGGSYYVTDHAVILVYGTASSGNITISGGTFNSDYACIWVGNHGISQIDITGGTFIGREGHGGLGLYLGSNVLTNIRDATITATGTAIEVKSGVVNITDSTVSSSAFNLGGDVTHSGSGAGETTLVINNAYVGATGYTGTVTVNILGATTLTNTNADSNRKPVLIALDGGITNPIAVNSLAYTSDIAVYYYNGQTTTTISWNTSVLSYNT